MKRFCFGDPRAMQSNPNVNVDAPTRLVYTPTPVERVEQEINEWWTTLLSRLKDRGWHVRDITLNDVIKAPEELPEPLIFMNGAPALPVKQHSTDLSQFGRFVIFQSTFANWDRTGAEQRWQIEQRIAGHSIIMHRGNFAVAYDGDTGFIASVYVILI